MTIPDKMGITARASTRAEAEEYAKGRQNAVIMPDTYIRPVVDWCTVAPQLRASLNPSAQAIVAHADQEWSGDMGCAWNDALDGHCGAGACYFAQALDSTLREDREFTEWLVVELLPEKKVYHETADDGDIFAHGPSK